MVKIDPLEWEIHRMVNVSVYNLGIMSMLLILVDALCHKTL